MDSGPGPSLALASETRHTVQPPRPCKLTINLRGQPWNAPHPHPRLGHGWPLDGPTKVCSLNPLETPAMAEQGHNVPSLTTPQGSGPGSVLSHLGLRHQPRTPRVAG